MAKRALVWAILGILPFLARAEDSPPAPVDLGTLTVRHRLNNYKVEIPSCASFGQRLTGLQFQVVDGGVYADRVILTYADRQTQLVKIGKAFQAGQESPWFDLGVDGFHDSRCVAELFLTAKAVPPSLPRHPAHIRVLGQMQKTSP